MNFVCFYKWVMLMDAAPGHSLVYHLSLFSRQAAKQQHRHHKPKNRLGWVTRPLLAFLVSLPSSAAGTIQQCLYNLTIQLPMIINQAQANYDLMYRCLHFIPHQASI